MGAPNVAEGRWNTDSKPEHDCPVCGAEAGFWCVTLPGKIGWQHADRPPSSWENTRET